MEFTLSVPQLSKRKSNQLNRIRVRSHTDAQPRKTALVLSAGAMFGAYQAGVWDRLCGVVQPDIVVGASVGCLNGWLIAGGATGDDLISRWMNLGDLANVRWRLPSDLTDGIIDNAVLELLIRNLYTGFSPVAEFGAVLTELRTLRPKLFRWPELDWTHIAGSCSVPLFLRHYRFDGSLYSDGGLVDPVPIWAAIEMGATRIIAINVLKSRPWYLHAIMGAARAYAKYDEPDCSSVQLIEINPTTRLGSAREAMNWTRENTARWIELGRNDAEAAFEQL